MKRLASRLTRWHTLPQKSTPRSTPQKGRGQPWTILASTCTRGKAKSTSLPRGSEVVEQRIRTERERFAAVLGTRPRARSVIEGSTDSEWVARCLEALGHEVIVDPNFAPMYATRSRKVKTDRRDARALAEACLLGAYRPAHRLSAPQRHVRGRLLVRDAVVRTRTRYISLIRALLRQRGYRVPSGGAENFIHRVQRLPLLCLRLRRGCGVRGWGRDGLGTEGGAGKGRAAFTAATAQKNINLGTLHALNVPCPPLPEKNEIVGHIQEAFARIDQSAAKAERATGLLSRLEQAILEKAFRGELVRCAQAAS